MELLQVLLGTGVLAVLLWLATYGVNFGDRRTKREKDKADRIEKLRAERKRLKLLFRDILKTAQEVEGYRINPYIPATQQNGATKLQKFPVARARLQELTTELPEPEDDNLRRAAIAFSREGTMYEAKSKAEFFAECERIKAALIGQIDAELKTLKASPQE